jgi:hypothetical protein
MNLLTQLLPGLRDVRTPLAVGILWTVATVLLYPSLPDKFRNELDLTSSAYGGFVAQLPVPIRAAIAGLGVYILGVALSYVGESLTRVVGAIVDLRGLIVAAALGIAIFFPGLLLIVGIAIGGAVAGASALAWKKTRQGVIEAEDSFTTWLRSIRSAAPATILDLVETITAGWSTERRERKYFLKEDAVRRVESSPFSLTRLVRRIEGWDLISALIYLDIDLDAKALNDSLFEHGITFEPSDPLPGLEGIRARWQTQISILRLVRARTTTGGAFGIRRYRIVSLKRR